ncbi:MAG: iron-containing redox enzyme family protein [Pseudomonadales bacterium]
MPHNYDNELNSNISLREDPKAVLASVFDTVIADFNECEGMQRLWRGELSTAHYAGLMREVFHHTRENPQLQALATVHFRGAQRTMVKPFLRHAISEVGHDQLALNDVASLGFSIDGVTEQQPLPATTALLAFPFYQIYNLNAVGYLGYLYFLESMPTSFGAEYMARLANMGVGPESMSFLQDHTTIDVGHTQAMQGYIDALVKTPGDLDAAIYAMRVTGELYGRMVTAAIASADNSTLFGTNHQEVAA